MDHPQLLIFTAVLSVMFRNIFSQQCRVDTHSIYQMMLKGHTYKTFKARPLSTDCIEACDSDVRCQSINYVMFNGICELNNRTKEARPDDFIKDRDRYYMMKAPNRVVFQCPPSWIAFKGSCYRRFTDLKNWNNADKSCKANGAQLVKIESAVENDFIHSEFQAVFSSRVSYWIGLTDAKTENVWKWSDGSKLTGYMNWAEKQPNNYGNQDCGSISIRKESFDGEWYDDKCSEAKRYICEM